LTNALKLVIIDGSNQKSTEDTKMDFGPLPVEFLVLIVLGIMIIGGLIAWGIVGYFWKKERRAWEQWQEEQLGDLHAFRRSYQKREDVVVSGNLMVNFITVDGGKNWYQYETTDDGGVKIIIDSKIAQPLLTQAIQNQLAIERAVRNGLAL
jgi:hypothetical protein